MYFPVVLYVCTGFFSVEDVLSPKLQLHEVGVPVLVSVKATVNGTFPEVGVAEKLAAGRTFPGAVKALMHTFVFESYQYFTNWIRKSSSFIPISKYFSVKCLKS